MTAKHKHAIEVVAALVGALAATFAILYSGLEKDIKKAPQTIAHTKNHEWK